MPLPQPRPIASTATQLGEFVQASGSAMRLKLRFDGEEVAAWKCELL
jgi:hypothetical protein